VISTLPELEILVHNLIGSADYPYPPKLASLNYSMGFNHYLYKDIIDLSPLEQYKETIKYIGERKEIMTELNIENGFYEENDNDISKPDLILKSLMNLIYLCFELPYLTKFHVELNQVNPSETKLVMIKKIITRLAESRRSLVLTFLAVQSSRIFEFLPFNPKLVVVDLMFD